MVRNNNKNNNNTLVPSLEQIKDVLEKSGYLLEQRICPIIEKYDYLATPNRQFQDPETNKPKEIDVEATKLNFLDDKNFRDTFETTLLISCKNNTTPVIFFSQNLLLLPLLGHVTIEGYPDGILDDKTKIVEPIDMHIGLEQLHHTYNVEWIASQFCQLKPIVIAKGSPKEKIEWSATHENLYDAIDTLSKAAVYYSKKIKEDIILTEKNKDCISLGVIYSILLFSGVIYKCKILKRKYSLIKTDHLTLYKSYRIGQMQRTFHIDVIHESYLPKLLKIINEEDNTTTNLLKQNKNLLKMNVERNFSESSTAAFRQ
jgi:hypothetical protein